MNKSAMAFIASAFREGLDLEVTHEKDGAVLVSIFWKSGSPDGPTYGGQPLSCGYVSEGSREGYTYERYLFR